MVRYNGQGGREGDVWERMMKGTWTRQVKLWLRGVDPSWGDRETRAEVRSDTMVGR